MRVWDDFLWFCLHKEKDFSCFPLVLANFLKYWGIKRQQSAEGLNARPKSETERCLYRNNQTNIYILYINIYNTLLRLKVLDTWEALLHTSPANLFHALQTMRWQSLRGRWSWVLLERRGVLHRWTWWAWWVGNQQVDLWNPSNKWFEKNGGGLILDLWVVKVSISENCTINRYGWFPHDIRWSSLSKLWPWMSTEITRGRFPAWDIKMVSWIHWLFVQFIMHSNGFSTRSPVYFKQLPRTGGAFCIEAHDMKTLNLPR